MKKIIIMICLVVLMVSNSYGEKSPNIEDYVTMDPHIRCDLVEPTIIDQMYPILEEVNIIDSLLLKYLEMNYQLDETFMIRTTDFFYDNVKWHFLTPYTDDNQIVVLLFSLELGTIRDICFGTVEEDGDVTINLSYLLPYDSYYMLVFSGEYDEIFTRLINQLY